MAAVFVLGHKGMLGKVVAQHLAERGHKVLTTTARFSAAETSLVQEVASSDADVVVNCAAVLSSRGCPLSAMFETNALLPQLLGMALGPSRLLVHASTDGVFSGAAGPYDVGALPDATDAYGLSKRLGELAFPGANRICLRSSIVGTSAGLLGWLLAQQGSVDGYTNHAWNGVTTLEWARACEELIVSDAAAGTIHLTCDRPVSKHELLATAARVFNLDLEVRPVCADRTVNRSLVPTHRRAAIEELLVHLRENRGAGR